MRIFPGAELQLTGPQMYVGRTLRRTVTPYYLPALISGSARGRSICKTVLGLATTLATRTVSKPVRSCPVVSAETRSPRDCNSREGFVMRAVRNGLRDCARFEQESLICA